MRWLLLVTMLTGCDSTTDCRIDQAIDVHVARPAQDCGTLIYSQYNNQPPVLPPYRAAHDCVIAAIESRTPFIVRWEVDHIDTSEINAVVGGLGGDSYVVQFFFEHRNRSPAHPIDAQVCATVGDGGVCADIEVSLCLSCLAGTTESPCE